MLQTFEKQGFTREDNGGFPFVFTYFGSLTDAVEFFNKSLKVKI